MVPLLQALNEMVWSQLKSPIRCENSTSVGVSNQAIISLKTSQLTGNSTGFAAETHNTSSDTSGLYDP